MFLFILAIVLVVIIFVLYFSCNIKVKDKYYAEGSEILVDTPEKVVYFKGWETGMKWKMKKGLNGKRALPLFFKQRESLWINGFYEGVISANFKLYALQKEKNK